MFRYWSMVRSLSAAVSSEDSGRGLSAGFDSMSIQLRSNFPAYPGSPAASAPSAVAYGQYPACLEQVLDTHLSG